MKLFKFLNHTEAKSYNVDKGAQVLYKSIVRTVMENFDNDRKKANTFTSVYAYTKATKYFKSDTTLLDTGTINLGLEDNANHYATIISDGKYFLLLYKVNDNYQAILCDGLSNVLSHTPLKEVQAKFSIYSNSDVFDKLVSLYEKSVDNNN